MPESAPHNASMELFFLDNTEYRIYSRISRPAYKLTPISVAENVAKISDSRNENWRRTSTLDLWVDNA